MSNQIKPLSEQSRWDQIVTFLFFLIHTLWFAAWTFVITYEWRWDSLSGSFMFWWFAVFVYLIFYVKILPKETLKSLFIWYILWLLQTYAWLEVIVPVFMNHSVYKSFSDIPLYYHIIPSIFFIMLTFLLKNLIIRIFNDTTWKILFIINLFLFFTPFILQYNNISLYTPTPEYIIEKEEQKTSTSTVIPITESVTTEENYENLREYDERTLQESLDELVNSYSDEEIKEMEIKYKKEIEEYEQDLLRRQKEKQK